MLGAGLNPNSNPYLEEAEQNTLASALPAAQAGFEGGGRLDSGLASAAAAQGATNALGNLNYGQYNTNVGDTLTAGNAATSALGTALSGTLGATGQAGSNFASALTGTLNAQGLASGNYNTQTGQQLQGASYAPAYDATALAGQQAALAAGTQQQQQAQNVLQSDINEWNYNQNLPYTALATYEQGLSGSGALNYASKSDTQPYFQSALGNALSSGIAGLSLGNGLGNSLQNAFGSSSYSGSALGNTLSNATSLDPSTLQNVLGLSSDQYVP